MKVLGLTSLLLVVVAANTRRHELEYIENAALGRGYSLHYNAATWQDARERCVQEGRQLAAPKSEAEFKVIQGLVRKMNYPSIKDWTGSKLGAWVGVSNLGDNRTWRNVDDEDIRDTGFSTWSGASEWKYSDNPNEPHCAEVDGINPGLRVFWCHLKQPYICETALESDKKQTR